MKPLNWRLYQERYNLQGGKCVCGKNYFPSRNTCTCGKRLTKCNMPRTGKIVSFTKVYAASEGFEDESPYFLALIELENNVLIFSQITDSEEDQIKIGTKVKKVFRKISDNGVINYGYKFMVEK